jgi:hypothetical protein
MAMAPISLPGAQTDASPPATPKIVILNSYDQDTPPHAAVRDTFMWELQKEYDEPIGFVQFNLQQHPLDARDSTHRR